MQPYKGMKKFLKREDSHQRTKPETASHHPATTSTTVNCHSCNDIVELRECTQHGYAPRSPKEQMPLSLRVYVLG